jgi:hypothetical protein
MNADTPAEVDLNQIERAVWMRCYEDGLMEIFLGLMLLLMGSGSVFLETFGMSEMSTILILLAMAAAAFVLFYLGKRIVTFPRIGRVKFGPKGKARVKKTTIIMSGSALVGLLAFVLATMLHSGRITNLSPDLILPLIWVINSVVVFGLWAWVAGIPRFFFIGILFALPLPLIIGLKELANVRIGYGAFAIPGSIVLLMGVVILARFIMKYPPLKEGR